MRARQRRRPVRRGFTLIETSLATVIVGVGVLAIVGAQQSFHQRNQWSTHASIATRLGNEIREMTLNMPRHDPVTGFDVDTGVGWGIEANELSVEDFDDLDDFDGDGTGLIFTSIGDTPNGPINARREIIANMDGWVQEVYVENVDPFNITEIEADGATSVIRVRVVVKFQSPFDDEPQVMTEVRWIAPR